MLTPKPYVPATGTVRWLGFPFLSGGKPRLEINGQQYVLLVDGLTAQTGGITLQKVNAAGEVLAAYHIDLTPDEEECSCPDHEHRRPGACKHILALKALLANSAIHF